jgi:endonuclease/exonuclease/phosphatase (EEP) superfamily protein YafD
MTAVTARENPRPRGGVQASMGLGPTGSACAAALATLALLACGASTARHEADDPGSSAAASPPSTSSLGRERFEPLPMPAGAPELRVLSFNINYGVGHDPSNVAAVAEANADLVLLQETTAESEAAFRKALAGTYPYVLFRDCCNAGGLGVLSKHPIREEAWLEPSVGWFPAWRVVVDTALGPVQALDVHLRPPMSDGGSWVAGYFTTRDDRREEIAAFWPALDPALPTIVAGDFNEDAQGRAIAFLAEKGLRSALPQVDPRAKTWRWQTRLGKLRLMLDHVVYGPGLQLRSAEVLDRGTSDHLPVLVVLGADASAPREPRAP